VTQPHYDEGPAPAADAGVPAFWRALGLPGLADIHVHAMPPRLQARVWEYFDRAGPLVGRDWPVTYRWPLRRRAAHLAGMGVRAFSALSYAHRPGMAEALTRWSLAAAARTAGMLPSATFFPEPGVLDQVRGALDGGARVFKVHLQVGGFDPREPVLDPVWGLLAEAGTPVVVHAGSGPVAAGWTGPGPIGDVLARHPRLTAVIAHLGAPEYAGFLALADRYPRVMLDTTMAFTPFFEAMAPFPADLRPALRDLGLAGRVLLGSDFPTIPYPYAQQLRSLADLDLGDAWLAAVCWHNAARLLGLPAADDGGSGPPG
jgi:hypothetical protein